MPRSLVSIRSGSTNRARVLLEGSRPNHPSKIAHCVGNNRSWGWVRGALLEKVVLVSSHNGVSLSVVQDPNHTLPKALAHPRHQPRVEVVAARLHHSTGPLGRILSLEDTTSDEHAVAAQLHQKGNIGGGREATGREGDHRKAANLLGLLDEVDWDLWGGRERERGSEAAAC